MVATDIAARGIDVDELSHVIDDVLEVKEGEAMHAVYDFEDYRLKVYRCIENNRDQLVIHIIHKLRNNIPLAAPNYKSLEGIFTGELGTVADYKREFHDTPSPFLNL